MFAKDKVLKGGVIAVFLFAALAIFDGLNNYAYATAPSLTPVTGLLSAEQSQAIAENVLTLKPNSFAAVALGAAFGSYYDASKSTCSPEKIFPASWVYAPSTKYYEETGEPYQNTYENVLLYDFGSNNKLILKPNGHRQDMLEIIAKAPSIANAAENAAAWIENEGPECILALKYSSQDLAYAQSDKKLARGINFVSVTPQMVNNRLEQVKGNCVLIGAFSNFGHSVASAPDATPVQDWDWWPTTHTFTQDELGLGMWLYTEDSCLLEEDVESLTSKVLSELEQYEPYRDNRELFDGAARSVIAGLATGGLTSHENFLVKNLPILLTQSYKQNDAGEKGLNILVHAITNGKYSQFSVNTEKGFVNVLYLTAVPGHSPEETLATIRQISEFIPALSLYSAQGFPEHLLVYDAFGPVNIGKGKLVAIGSGGLSSNWPPATTHIGHELAHTIHPYIPGWLIEGWAEYLNVRAQEDVSRRLGLEEKREKADYAAEMKLVEEGLWDFRESIEGFNRLGLNQMENFSPAKKYAKLQDGIKSRVAPFVFLRDLHRIIGPDAMKALSIRLSEQEDEIQNSANSIAQGNAATFETVVDCMFLQTVVDVTKEYAPSMVNAARDHVVKNGIGELPKCN